MKKEFDFEKYKKEAVEDLLSGKPLSGADGVLAPLIKQFLEAALEVEVKSHLTEEKAKGNKNRLNGYMGKEMRSLTGGAFPLDTPRDRAGTFEPQIVAKRQVFLGEDLERKVIKLYARGMSYEDICTELRDIYGIEASPAFLSEVTDKVLPLMEQWRSRPLEPVYCFTFLDAMHFRVRGENNQVQNKMLYLIMGVNPEGRKDVLGMYIADTEGAKFWLQVLQDLKSRGVEDLLIVSVDGLKGFEEAIRTFYPKAEVQQCIVHQIRHSIKFVSDKEVRAFIKDLKKVYKAIDRPNAEKALDELESIWGKKYPHVIESWRTNWERLSTFFKYPDMIRRVIYTTNPIESLNRRIRKVTKTKGALASETALFKLVYLVIQEVTHKWTMSYSYWGQIAGQLHILFGERARINTRV
jgi:putative transposase